MASADVETGRMPDVIRGRHRSQKEQQTRRQPRKTSEDSAEASPRTGIPAMEQRRRTRPDGVRSLIHRRQQAAVRRASESALLPPIRVSSLRQQGSSPTHDANDTSSPTSILSLPVGTVEEEDDNNNNSNNNNNNADDGPPTTLMTQLAPLSDREARSPANRRDTQSMLSLAETTDTPRLSPIAGSDHLRQKAERRITRSVNDTLNDVTATAKSPPTAPAESGIPAPPRASVRAKSNRRISTQSLPKLSVNEEPFSIRRKIEQFRKWHEEQYADKLQKLKVDAEKERREASNKPPSQTPGAVEIDFAKLLEENMKNFKKTEEKTLGKDSGRTPVISETKASTEKTSPRKPTRCKSGASWRTWRDVNDSYAYDDVEKYIEENELLPPERVKWISEWLGEVEAAFSGEQEEGEDKDLRVDYRGFP